MQKTILVVEDDSDLRNFLIKILAANNYKVAEAADGAQALEAVEKYLPDLVLLDFGLPKVPGETVCVKIKQDHPEIIVIALTEKNHSSDVVHGLQIGADDYISKPFDAEELVARIDTRFKTVVKGQSEPQEKPADVNLSSSDVNDDQIGREESKTEKIILRESIILIMMRVIFVEAIFGLSLLILSILFSYLSSYTNITSFSSLYFIVLAGGLLINIGIVIMIASKWNSEYTEISKEGVVKHSGILHRKEQKYACNFVEGAKLDQSLFGLLFNYGTIELYDPALKEQVYLLNIANPKKYSEIIQNIVSKEKDKP
ncbi:MAG: response regulator transcription factor, partial [Candidatus Levybacteria bacterium]|nr:response regulator transcription factor [Candidatus Levybacteria bacterium]